MSTVRMGQEGVDIDMVLAAHIERYGLPWRAAFQLGVNDSYIEHRGCSCGWRVPTDARERGGARMCWRQHLAMMLGHRYEDEWARAEEWVK